MSDWNRIGEETFKDSKWTSFHQGNPERGEECPYDFIFVQAPVGVAAVVVQNAIGVDVNCRSRYDSRDRGYHISEEIDPPDYMFVFKSTNSCLILRHDCIGYYLNKIWPQRKWSKDDD